LSVSAISKRYAKALAGIGAEKQQVELYGEELGRIRSALTTEAYLRLILESPTFPSEKKSAILDDLSSYLQLSAGMKDFLKLLLEKDRLQDLVHSDTDFRKLADELSGVLRAKIYSATELNKNQLNAIRQGLETQSGKKIELKVDLKPELIGGIQVEIGGKLFDGSLTTQLQRIEDTLKKG
jgi:F-type H+-transporting ATPase subunit delta